MIKKIMHFIAFGVTFAIATLAFFFEHFDKRSKEVQLYVALKNA